MTTVNDNYPKTEVSDAHLKELALQNYQTQQVRQHNFPTEVISLPSQGKLYPTGNPLSSGKVEMKYMTAREEDILTSANLIRQGVVLDKLFQSMIVSPVNYNDIIIGDKNAVMIAARILGYGKNLNIKYSHPITGQEEDIVVDLSTLKEKEIDYSLFNNSNEIEYELPNTSNKVTFKILSHADEKFIAKEISAMKKANISSEMTIRLKRQITSINGNSDKKVISEFVDKGLLATDSRDLRSYMNKVAPDVNMTFTFEGSDGYIQEGVSLPVTLSFFYPTL